MAMEKTIRHGSNILVNKLNYRPINRGDILVFHFPVGDTVIDLPEYQSMRPYYDVIRELGRGNADSGRQIVLSDPDNYPLTISPVYKREVYLKRCVATAGDTLQMRDEVVYINGRAQAWPQESETYFHVVTNGRPLDERIIRTYEGNKLVMRDGKIYINDREETSYTFKMNYYWVIGDNLHGSQDSRYWGFVPEDHMIGKVSVIL